MTSKYLRAVYCGDQDGKGGTVLLRSCAYCANRACPVLFGIMINYAGEPSRYPFCSTVCRDTATALRRLGLPHYAEQFDPPCRAELRSTRRHGGQASRWEGHLARP